MCGSKRRVLIHVSTCITICETLVTYSQTDSRTLRHSFCVVGDFGYIHCNKYKNLVLNVSLVVRYAGSARKVAAAHLMISPWG